MSELNSILNLKADQCVKCGLCLPHCPTYRLFQDENESPRGRIALIQALVNEQISPSPTLRKHLDHCLGCRNCERICPSGVDYAWLLDHARHSLLPRRTIKGLALARNKKAQHLLQTVLYFYQHSGLQTLARSSGIIKLLRLKRIESLLPKVAPAKQLATHYPAHGQSKGKLGLFVGCTGQLFDQATLEKTRLLLQHLGYEVIIPPAQTCCGALHQHQGQIEASRGMARQNTRAFEGFDTIIYIASGCGAQLHDYPRLFTGEDDDQGKAATFSKNIMEITAFLAKEDLSSLHFRPLAKRVAVHTPCSLRNGLRRSDQSQAVLANIPDLQLSTIPAETGCCGAAGSYMLTQPVLSTAIRQRTLDCAEQLDTEIISTVNVGCGLHLQAGLRNGTRCIHPVSLLVDQLNLIDTA